MLNVAIGRLSRPLLLAATEASSRIKMSGASSSSSGCHYYAGADGARSDKEALLRRVRDHAVDRRLLLVGENHSDPAAHRLELEVLRTAHAEARSRGRTLALSLEFWDREAQTVMDEYMKGFVSWETFLSDSRPPSNASDYRPMLDFCRDNSVPVVAANCPRRYTKLVSKDGRKRLAELAEACEGARRLLAPLPYAQASREYRDGFMEVMGQLRGGVAEGKRTAAVPESMLDAQSLWDATMAHAVHLALQRHDLVLHVAGYFHVKRNLGILEHLKVYEGEEKGADLRKDVLSVVVMPEDRPEEFDEREHAGLADLVVLTDLNQVKE